MGKIRNAGCTKRKILISRDLKQHHGKKIFAYYNLHKKVWSVRHKGKVIAHAEFLIIDSPEFKVSQSGRNRVLREKRKNVHAGVVGILNTSAKLPTNRTRVSYNPYIAAHFYEISSGSPVQGAATVVMCVESFAQDGSLIPKARVYASRPVFKKLDKK